MQPNLFKVLNQECLTIRIWPEDDGYIAECLDIPGCLSEGNTWDEARVNVSDAISLCLGAIRDEYEKRSNASNEQEHPEFIREPLKKFLFV